ncbi:MAG TPA: PASTA domain-containing protein [Solirubrobacteraceae bacterium]|nr:PASTA domain-containing protein [Solirubrobacteraceae bacterium]
MKPVGLVVLLLGAFALMLGAFAPPAAANITLYPTPTPGSDPFGMTETNVVWFTESQAAKLGKIDQSGRITEIPLPTGSDPLSLTPTAFGTVAVAEHGTAAIDEVATDGTVTTHPIPGGLQPYAVTLGSDSGVWFSAQPATSGGNGAVGVMRPTPDRPITLYPVSGVPWGISRDNYGNVWFALQRAGGGAIGRITTDGAVTVYPIGPGAIPVDLAPASDGNMWFTDQNHGHVGRVTPSGAVKEFAIGATSTILGIAEGSSSGVVAADPGGKALYLVTSAGYRKVPVPGSPQHLTAAPQGGMYFTLREGKIGLLGGNDVTPGCLAPKLVGKKLAAAKKLLAAADCKLGPVTLRKHRGRKGVVLTQNPPPGELFPEGFRVALTVSR